MVMSQRLKDLFALMAELTAPECVSGCKIPHSCCSGEYCDMAVEFGASLEQVTGHPTLKFMGPTGCVLPPYQRPLCTLHVCCINNIGFKPGDPSWTGRYFFLRNQIDEEMARCNS